MNNEYGFYSVIKYFLCASQACYVLIYLIITVIVSQPSLAFAQQHGASTLDEYFKLGVEYVQNAKFEDAEKMFKKVIEFDPFYTDAYNNLGNIYMLRNNFELALEQYTKVINLSPANDGAYSNIGLIYMKSGSLSKAIEMFQKAVELNPRSAEAFYNLATCYLLFNSIQNAETSIKKALEINPDDDDFKTVYAQTLSAAKKYDEARKIFEEVIRSDASNFDALNELGLICLYRKEYLKAIEYFDKIKGNKNLEKSSKVYYNLALCHERLKNSTEARDAYAESIKRNPNYAAVRNDYGSFLFSLDKLEEAQFQFKEAVTIDSNYVNAAVNLAKTYYIQQRYDEAAAVLTSFLSRHPKEALIYDQLGLVYYGRKEFEKAKTAFDLAIEYEPALASAHYNLGVLYDEVKKYENAISEYKLALLFDKEHILAMNNLGYLYLNLRKFKEAIDILKKAIGINPQFSWAHYNLALAYYNSGRRNDALFHLEKVIECEDKNSDLAAAAQKAISSIKGRK